MKTLNEVVEIVGLTRRAIQEYEEAGLAIKPTTKNKYGYLLYDTPAIERLWQLRFYKELGYNMTEIKKINKTSITESELEKVIQKLTEKKERLDSLINIAQAMKDTGISFSAFKKMAIDTDIDSEDVFGVLGASLDLVTDIKEEDWNIEIIEESDSEEIYEAMRRIVGLKGNGENFESPEVQKEVAFIHNITAKAFSKSIMLFRSFLMYLEPESIWAKELEEEINKENVDFLRNAISYYCEINSDNEVDRELYEAIDNIGILGIEKYTTNSPEVQNEVKRIHNFFKAINLYKEEAKLVAVRKISQLYGSKAYKQMIDNGAQRGVSWFVSRAIEIYCNNIEHEEN